MRDAAVHAGFQKRMSDSERARVYTGNIFEAAGHKVDYGIMTIADSADKWQQHSDNGDLWIDDQWLVEVHHILQWPGEEWPFKHFIIDNVSSFDRKQHEPWLYICWNKPMTHYAKVLVEESRQHWYVMSFTHSKTGEDNACYYCPLEYVEFKKDPGLRNEYRRG